VNARGAGTMRASTIALAVALGAASTAFASEAAHGEHAPSIGTLVLPIINFSIFAFILWRYAWPAVRSTLADRLKTVGKQLSDSESALREARSELEAIEALRARSREDGEKLVAEIRDEAEKQAGALLTAARGMAERIRRDAELLSTQERDRAAHAIRAEVAGRVARRAAEIVRERFGENEQRRAVAEFLTEVRS
jgi:F-type H+-transporting ATPase subunit b